MGHDLGHVAAGPGHERRLMQALALTSAFLIVEIAGGIVTGSLALLSDAAHMFTDVTALAIALAAVRIGRRPVDERRSFGYQRFEILAAAFNALLLFAVAGYIVHEAWQRFRSPPQVHASGMLVIATVGLVINFLALRLLAGGKQKSLNVQGAYLEVWSDLLGSVGVIVAAIAIFMTGWQWLDPVVAVAIGLWVLPRTWNLLRQTTHILLEGTPADMDMTALRSMIEATRGVKAIHDLHVWTLASEQHVLTAHVVVDHAADRQRLLVDLTARLIGQFGLTHTTLQLEDEPCADMHGTEDRAHEH